MTSGTILSKSSPGSFLYFAFGSNLCTRRIRDQNPSAVFKDIAVIDDYALKFIVPSKTWKGCAATILKSVGSETMGVVWQIDLSHLPSLDKQEGVHLSQYKRISAQVKSLTNPSTTYDVYTYHIADAEYCVSKEDDQNSISTNQFIPSKTYKDIMIEGALEHNMPLKFIERLKQEKDNGIEVETNF